LFIVGACYASGKHSENLGWSFVSSSISRRGMEHGTYYRSNLVNGFAMILAFLCFCGVVCLGMYTTESTSGILPMIFASDCRGECYKLTCFGF
jgi:hypothetical protein